MALFVFGRMSSFEEPIQLCDLQTEKRKADVVYGHVHVAKTGGTTVAGYMALNYERVCTNKGYSHNFYQQNERNRLKLEAKLAKKKKTETDNGKNRRELDTSFSSMQEIGFEDCDYISLEQVWYKWKHFVGMGDKMELHVPCRDPIDHILSSCNHRYYQFNCSANDIELEIKKCLMLNNRFQYKMLDFNSTEVKCYDFRRMTDYFEYMDNKLDKKRIRAEYVHRASNRKRDKDNECLLKDVDLQEKVHSILVQKYDYYDFCSKCLKSDMNMLS